MVAYENLKTNEKSSWLIPKVHGRGRLRELFITKFKSVQAGFHKCGHD